ncbi:MAG: hypothetical protein ACQESR_15865, partial [Planctomycetota bacterium]
MSIEGMLPDLTECEIYQRVNNGNLASPRRPDPHEFISWVNQARQLRHASPHRPDPHEFISWVNQARQLRHASPRRPDPHEFPSWVNQARELSTRRRTDQTPT